MFVLLVFIVFILLYIYLEGTKNFKYWETKGIKYCKPLPFFGNSCGKYFRQISPTDLLTNIYKTYKDEKCVGIFESNYPALVIRDPELIKLVLSTDFMHFYPKGMNMFEREPLMNNLFSADGDLWKLLRQKFTAAFTTGKMKAMYPILLKQVDRLERIICDASKKNVELDVRDLMARYTIDIITNCGFGVDSNSLNDESSVFRKLGKRIFNIKYRDSLVYMFKFIATNTFKNFNFFAPEIEDSTTEIFEYILEQRNNMPNRQDFMDILLQMRDKNTLSGDSLTKRNKDGEPEKCEIISDKTLLIAQAFILFAAGYETAAAAISFTLNQLAYNQEIQRKCHDEVDKVLKKHGELTYEAVIEMKYLEMVFKEGMRMYPPIGFLIRQCARKYTFSDINLTIDKGIAIFIPLQALQNDEIYFEQPEKFIPERFHPDNADKLNKFSYLPFGAGPRLCIGMRFGILESVAGLAKIFQKYSVMPSTNSRLDLVTDPTIALVQNIKGGIPLKFVRRRMI